MEFQCPRCNGITIELIECDCCSKIGCVKCITKKNRQWICSDCKDGVQSSSPESALASLFG